MSYQEWRVREMSKVSTNGLRRHPSVSFMRRRLSVKRLRTERGDKSTFGLEFPPIAQGLV